MLARLIAALALAAGGHVLGSATPAAACSCVGGDPSELAARAEVAFVGVLVSGRSDDDVVTHVFDVEEVRAGDVRRHQDVATPRADAAGCGVEWETGTRMLVLGRLDEQGRVTSDPCSGSMVVPDAAARGQDVVWSAVVIGVVGALGMVVVRRLARRPVRG